MSTEQIKESILNGTFEYNESIRDEDIVNAFTSLRDDIDNGSESIWKSTMTAMMTFPARSDTHLKLARLFHDCEAHHKFMLTASMDDESFFEKLFFHCFG